MPGDIRASEVFEDREMLNRLGYGIMDVEWGKGEIGSENVRDFSYVVAQDQDPKFYRRMVYDLIGRYFSNDLAKVLWDKFIDHKWVLSERAHREIDLKTAAQDWMQNYSHNFLKEWTFTHAVPTSRIRGSHEPSRGFMGSVVSQVVPPLGELLDSGFTVINVIAAALHESLSFHSNREAVQEAEQIHQEVVQAENPKSKPTIAGHFLRFINPFMSRQKKLKKRKVFRPLFVVKRLEAEHQGIYYVRLLANLTGHHFDSEEEAAHYWREVLEHKWYMSEKAKKDVGIRQAALDYFRRLNLFEQVESGHEI